jgi:hypothetical protein
MRRLVTERVWCVTMHMQTASTAGFWVVTRPPYFSDEKFQASAGLSDAQKHSYEHMVEAYRGFDGDVWPNLDSLGEFGLVAGLAPVSLLGAVEKYVAKISDHPGVRLLYLRSSDNTAKAPPPSDFTLSGLDVGVIASETNFYSIVFHEVLFGRVNEMVRFRAKLNSGGLLKNHSDASSLTMLREKSLASGSDLETFEANETIEVFEVFERSQGSTTQ